MSRHDNLSLVKSSKPIQEAAGTQRHLLLRFPVLTAPQDIFIMQNVIEAHLSCHTEPSTQEQQSLFTAVGPMAARPRHTSKKEPSDKCLELTSLEASRTAEIRHVQNARA
eukprot:scaffold705_cov402-Prasinococcus_capsulatus_cf.AAC.35